MKSKILKVSLFAFSILFLMYPVFYSICIMTVAGLRKIKENTNN